MNENQPTTQSCLDWINDLTSYQNCSGKYGMLPARNDGSELMAIRRWVERMRRFAAAGNLPTVVALRLALCGISMVRNKEKTTRSNQQSEAAVAVNIAALKRWMALKDGGKCDLAYAESLESEAARKIYRFLEHVRLRIRLVIMDEAWLGKLTVIDERRRNANGRHTEWRALCSCGNDTWARAADLRSGKKRSCGCLKYNSKLVRNRQA